MKDVKLTKTNFGKVLGNGEVHKLRMQDDWLGDPAPLVRYLAEFAAAGADMLRGALPKW